LFHDLIGLAAAQMALLQQLVPTTQDALSVKTLVTVTHAIGQNMAVVQMV
jgi:hypothetical protein